MTAIPESPDSSASAPQKITDEELRECWALSEAFWKSELAAAAREVAREVALAWTKFAGSLENTEAGVSSGIAQRVTTMRQNSSFDRVRFWNSETSR